MIIRYSKQFQKATRKLSGKLLDSVKKMITEVKQAESTAEITDCKKLKGYDNVYRIRIGDLRALFLVTISYEPDENDPDNEKEVVNFEYLVSRGEAYSKKIKDQLRDKDE